MRAWLPIAVAALAIGCKKSPPAASETDTQPSPVSSDAGGFASVRPDAGIAQSDCRERVSKAAGWVRTSFVAKDYHGARQASRRGLAEVPEVCRDGLWYLTAAMLLDTPGSQPVEAPGVVIKTRDEALAAAVAQPPERSVLVYVAFTAALGATTKLPSDACALVEADVAAAPEEARASIANEAHYVCGHAALAGGDAKTAKERFGAIDNPRRFADLELRQAEAELALGNTKVAKKLAKKAAAIDTSRMGGGYANYTDREAIVAAAKAIAK